MTYLRPSYGGFGLLDSAPAAALRFEVARKSRSIWLGLVACVVAMVLSLLAGFAYRKGFRSSVDHAEFQANTERCHAVIIASSR